MTEDTAKQRAEAENAGKGPCACGTDMGSMPRKCMGMMGRRLPLLLFVLAGAVLIGLGALIVYEPRVIVWLLAAATAFVGIMLLLMAGFMRRMRARPRG